MELDYSELMDAVGGSSEPDQDIIERFRNDGALEVPIQLTDLDMWANYTNDDLYVMDRKIREFFLKTRYRREKKEGYRTTASIVFAWIYGRAPTPADGAACRMIHLLLRYYCTSWTGKTTYKGRPVDRVYRFSRYATTNKRPYSLRLRLEEADGSDRAFREGPHAGEDKRVHGRFKDRGAGGVQAEGRRDDS